MGGKKKGLLTFLLSIMITGTKSLTVITRLLILHSFALCLSLLLVFSG